MEYMVEHDHLYTTSAESNERQDVFLQKEAK